jgi:hypothetical protein
MNLHVRPLRHATPRDLQMTVDRMTDPAVLAWLGTTVSDSLAARRRRDADGDSLHVLLYDKEGPCGWLGWLRYPLLTDVLETSTYLAPDVRGTGVNQHAKSLAWQLAFVSGTRLISSVNTDNVVSNAAMRRTFPDAPVSLIWEPHRNRWANLYRLNDPPVAVRLWPSAIVDELRSLLPVTTQTPAHSLVSHPTDLSR